MELLLHPLVTLESPIAHRECYINPDKGHHLVYKIMKQITHLLHSSAVWVC